MNRDSLRELPNLHSHLHTHTSGGHEGAPRANRLPRTTGSHGIARTGPTATHNQHTQTKAGANEAPRCTQQRPPRQHASARMMILHAQV